MAEDGWQLAMEFSDDPSGKFGAVTDELTKVFQNHWDKEHPKGLNGKRKIYKIEHRKLLYRWENIDH
jgi:hypothetical protein